jgi:hypothetical protein
MSRLPLRLLSGLPLIIMAIALFVLGIQGNDPPAPRERSFADLLDRAGRADDAVDWAALRAQQGSPEALRRLVRLADRSGDTARRAVAQQRLVRTGDATLGEHIDAARALAAAGALKDALTILYNADLRFTDRLDEDFLSFYVAVAIDAGRRDVARPLSRRIWKRTGSERALSLMESLREVRRAPP